MKTLKGVDALLFLLDWRKAKEATKIEIGGACSEFCTGSTPYDKKDVVTSLWAKRTEAHGIVIRTMNNIGASLGYNGMIDDYYKKAKQHNLRLVSSGIPKNGIFITFVYENLGAPNSLTAEKLSLKTMVDSMSLSPKEVAILEDKEYEPISAFKFSGNPNLSRYAGGTIQTVTHGVSTLLEATDKPTPAPKFTNDPYISNRWHGIAKGEEYHYKLCYISGQVAYFTTRELSKQWGDDWDDVPYEHNAGEPYNHRNDGHNVIKRYFESSLVTPHLKFSDCSPYSVQKINRKEVPWLSPDQYSKATHIIFAGEPLDTFIEKIKSEGGEVYAPLC